MRTTTAITLSVAVSVAPCTIAQEVKGISRILLDRTLQERPVTITELNQGTITYMDGSLVRTESTAEYLAFMTAPPAPPQAQARDALARKAPPEKLEEANDVPSPVLELIDGQMLTGSLAGASPSGDSFSWSHRLLGPVQLKVDHLHRLRVTQDATEIAAPADNDLIVFVNGDRMEAFVEVLADPLIASVGEQKHTIPLSRIAQVVFANPPQEPEGAFAWLEDGSVVAVREIRTTRVGEALLRPRLSAASESPETGAGSASLPLTSISGFVFDITALRPLAALEPEAQRPGPGRRWTQPMQVHKEPGPLGASDILLPGPMAVRWSIPDTMTRLVADAELPRDSWSWGDFELVVAVVSGGTARELSRTRMNADAPGFRVNADLGSGAGRTLEIRIEPGEHGPVQDRVMLRRPMLAAAARTN